MFLQQHITKLNAQLYSALRYADAWKAEKSHFSDTFLDLAQRLQGLIFRCQDLNIAEQPREEITSIRQTVNEMINEIDQLQGEVAGHYRNILGSQKDSFEKLSASEQQTSNPEAFHFKEMFHTAAKLGEQIRVFNGELMNVSGQLEHEQLEHMRTPPVHHVEDHSQVPAPPTLSP